MFFKSIMILTVSLVSVGAFANNFILQAPPGNVALLHDGNVLDKDDIAAFPMAAAMMKYAGYQNKVKHLKHSNNVCANSDRQLASMQESADCV